jgi:hypothetical protein
MLAWFQGTKLEDYAMRRTTVAVAILTLLTTPVLAQQNQQRQETTQEIQKRKDAESVDQQYKTMLKRAQSQKEETVRVDPWANMRAPTEGKR